MNTTEWKHDAGAKVTWKSQAGGSWKEKTGTVVERLPKGKTPTTPGAFRGIAAHRYVVNVGGRIYTPNKNVVEAHTEAAQIVEDAEIDALRRFEREVHEAGANGASAEQAVTATIAAMGKLYAWRIEHNVWPPTCAK